MPEDYGSKFTDEETKRLNEKIDKVYREAHADIQRKMDDFNRGYEAKDAMYQEMLNNGEITKDQYRSWQRGQVFQGKLWQAKRDQIESVISKANHASMDIINGGTPSVFAENMNFISFDMEKQAKADFGFTLADKDTVTRLIKDDPDLLPKWKINEPKDYTWNKQKLGNCVTQGIIQGESLDKIGKRISDGLASSNKSHMMTFARTAMTGAQNAGRLTQMERAEKLGVKVEKQWMATLDSYTRDSHARLDGETVPLKEEFSNGCMYPGDPGGPPAEVYNCRCTMVSEVVNYPSFYSRRDNENGSVVNKLGPDTVANVTYKDWKITKGVMEKAKKAEEIEKISETLLKASALGSGTVNYPAGNKMSLDYKYKGFDSLFRKITTKSASKGISKEEYAGRVTDALRFTSMSPAETLTQDYFTMVGALQSQGYGLDEVTNTFVNYTSYRGINTLVRSPEGYTFELQFHTPQSLEIKEINHKLYEEERKLDKVKDAQKIKDIAAIENANAKSIVTPTNVDRIENVR